MHRTSDQIEASGFLADRAWGADRVRPPLPPSAAGNRVRTRTRPDAWLCYSNGVELITFSSECAEREFGNLRRGGQIFCPPGIN
jgi:hypothetical protein